MAQTKSTAEPADTFDLNRYIYIKGARSNNLKNIDLVIPKDQLVVVTGVSGSGKSTLTMDTLFAEGQRRYVESLSSYARQFLARMKKPDVDYIKGIAPAIAIEQKVSTRNTRSTVGTLTEIYDYLRLLYARIGKTYSPVSGNPVKRHQVSDVLDFLQSLKPGTKIHLLSPLPVKYTDRILLQELKLLLQKGYTRVRIDGETAYIEEVIAQPPFDLNIQLGSFDTSKMLILIDRLVVKEDEELWKRAADSIQTAFYESEGNCMVEVLGDKVYAFNNRFELDGMEFPDPTPNLFNFNNPYGACPVCEGFGMAIGIDENKVIPNKTLSVFDGAVACWKGQKAGLWRERFITAAAEFDFPIHKPYKELTKQQKDLLWLGNKKIRGINDFFTQLEEKLYKIQNRVMLARYRGKTTCNACRGGRLRKEASYVKIDGKSIQEIVTLPIDQLKAFFDNITLSDFDKKIGNRLILEITNRLHFMLNTGLNYLTLNRMSHTLSGGETQRINLTRTLGSNLTASLYILDEPSIGLHPKDIEKLLEALKSLRDMGNTVVVVEHEEEVIKKSDYLIDIGPAAGIHGGEVVFAGKFNDIYKKAAQSLTARYLKGELTIPVPEIRRKFTHTLKIKGASQHNLKDIDVTFPLNTLTVVTGVSGSGKTTLIKQILYPALKKHLEESVSSSIGDHLELKVDNDIITQVEFVGQSPIGRSSRSNPVTYVKAYDAIRKLMANRQLSLIRGFKPKHFSFNVEGGRCETCKGEGEQIVEMQFLADVRLECEECRGKRFKQEVLDVEYKDKNIADILDMTVDEALDFFEDHSDIIAKMQPLAQVGLGYIKLGQSSSTLSGGEAQRVKLAAFLTKEPATYRNYRRDHVYFIFDEPTTGLHFHDIKKLLAALNALVERGHSVLVIEHNMEIIKSADWVIDLGPEGGEKGGHLVFEGTPEDLIKVKESFTGRFLKEKI